MVENTGHHHQQLVSVLGDDFGPTQPSLPGNISNTGSSTNFGKNNTNNNTNNSNGNNDDGSSSGTHMMTGFLPRHTSISSDNSIQEVANQAVRWDSFVGFQWDATTTVNEDDKIKPFSASSSAITTSEMTLTTMAPTTFNSVLSVPMLPNVPTEPMYRQHRSLSFSTGQDPSFFGYDDYDDPGDGNLNGGGPNSSRHGYKTSLETMAEEDDEQDIDFWNWSNGLESPTRKQPRQRQMSFDTGSTGYSRRVRSQSSGAAFGFSSAGASGNDTSGLDHHHQLLAPYNNLQQQSPLSAASVSFLHRPTEQWQNGIPNTRRRRSSIASLWNQESDIFSNGGTIVTSETQYVPPSPNTPTTPHPLISPLYAKDAITPTDQHDSPFQRRLSQQMDYAFPDNNNQSLPLIDHQRRKSCTNAQIQPSIHQGYSAAMRGLTGQLESIHLQAEPPSPLPYSSFSTPFMRPHDQNSYSHQHHYPQQFQQQQQYGQTPEIGHPQQQQQQQQYPTHRVVYHQQPSLSIPPSHHIVPFPMHPYQQAQDNPGMVFHYGPSLALMSQQKPMDNHHPSQPDEQQQQSQQQQQQQQQPMNYQYTSSHSDQQQAQPAGSSKSSTVPTIPPPTYSSVVASNNNHTALTNNHPNTTNTNGSNVSSGNSNDNTHIDPRIYHESGKGVPLNKFPAEGPLYMVEFKAGRIDFFYVSASDSPNGNSNGTGGDGMIQPLVGDLVIVEADRGKDLGKVALVALTCEMAMKVQQQQRAVATATMTTNNQENGNGDSNGDKTTLEQQETQKSNERAPQSLSPSSKSAPSSTDEKQTAPLDAQKPTVLLEKEQQQHATISPSSTDPMYVKRIYRLAAPDEINMLLIKNQDEQRALVICQQKIKQRKLQMEVVDAEYQWDRRKLTFYFSADKRIDFRELVREMFKIYKTRIWMCAVANKKKPSDICA